MPSSLHNGPLNLPAEVNPSAAAHSRDRSSAEEQLAVNQPVGGSTPSGLAISPSDLRLTLSEIEEVQAKLFASFALEMGEEWAHAALGY